MKPTFGRVSIDGVAPRSYSSDHVGPLARTVDDAAIAMEAISGHVAGSSTTFHRAVPAYSLEARGGVRGLRIGVDRKYCERGQPAVLEAFRNALTTLEGLGCFVRDISFPTFTDVLDLTNLIFQPEVSLWYETFIAQHASEVTPALRSGARTAEVISACDYLRAGQRRRQMQVAVAQQMREVDVLALPTYFLALRPFPASSDMALGGYPKIGDYEPTGTDGIYYTLPFNLLGLPAVSVPCRIGDDGCVGLQIVGKAWDETTVLRAARAYEEAAGWTHVAPPVL
jgi:aspartyl-tRNA(Asn)/glutamyl-tRNA(Gln) amidotransferase subunit A